MNERPAGAGDTYVSARTLSSVVIPEDSEGVIDPALGCYRRVLTGVLPNQDTYVPAPGAAA